MTDAILKEMHAIKDANARKYRGRNAALLKDLQKRQQESGRVLLPVVSRKRKDKAR